VPIYYLLLICERFHDYPHLNSELFDVGFIPVTITKIIGSAAVAAAMILPWPQDAARPRRGAMTSLFAAFALWPLLGTVTFGLPLPVVSLSYLSSLALLMAATRAWYAHSIARGR
jgi:hypothetical protein